MLEGSPLHALSVALLTTAWPVHMPQFALLCSQCRQLSWRRTHACFHQSTDQHKARSLSSLTPNGTWQHRELQPSRSASLTLGAGKTSFSRVSL